MTYEIEFRPQSIKDLDSLPNPIALRIISKIERLKNDLNGDVKRLTNFTPEYRLRVGAYRVLFTVSSDQVVIYRVLHRREAYRT